MSTKAIYFTSYELIVRTDKIVKSNPKDRCYYCKNQVFGGILNCGPACLKMIAKFYGRDYSIQYLRERSYITRMGVSMLGISDAAENIGFRTNGVQLTFDQLYIAPLPCILHWNQRHFVVCYGLKKKKNGDYIIKISDPASGKYVLNKEAFLKCWASSKQDGEDIGMALLLAPTPEFYDQQADKDAKENRKVSYYFRYLLPYKSQLFQLIVGLLLGSVLSLIFPFLTQAMVDQGIGNANLSLITLILIAQLVLFVTQLGVGFLQNWITLHMNTRISISLISDFLAKLMKLPIRGFDSKNVGDIMQRIGDNSRIRSFLTGTTLTTLFSFVNFFIFAGIMAYYDLTILLIFLVGNALYVTWIALFLRYRRKLDYARFAQASAEQSNMVQIVTGMQEIKLQNCEKQQRWKWERIQVKLFKISMKGLALGQYQQLGSVFFSQTTSLLISFIAAKAVVEGNITLGMMMSISYIIGQLSGPIGQVIGFLQAAQDAKISLEGEKEIQNKADEKQDLGEKIGELPENKDITLSNVYFTYDGADRNYVLDDVNLTIPHDKVTAVVGASGSGKTTLVKLLLGFYPPNKGEIKVGGIPLQDINPYLWRASTGAVMQAD